MLAVDELLDAAAGDIEPQFDLDDIRGRADHRVKRRRVGGAALALIFVTLAVGGSTLAGRNNQPTPDSAVDSQSVFETLDVASAPTTDAALGPRFITAASGSPARFHMPAIFDEPPLPPSLRPDVLRAAVHDEVDVFAIGEATDPNFAVLHTEDDLLCLFVVHPDAGSGGFAETCMYGSESIPFGFVGPMLRCCPAVGLVPRDVVRVGYDSGEPDGVVWADSSRGVYAFTGAAYLDPKVGFGTERLRYELDDGRIIGWESEDPTMTRARPIASTATVTLAGGEVTNRFDQQLRTGFATCSLYDGYATADVALWRDGHPPLTGAAFTRLSTNPAHGATFAWPNVELGNIAPVIAPVSRLADGRLALFTSADTDQGRLEVWVDCGLDYLDARTVRQAVPVALARPGPARLRIAAIDVDAVIGPGVSIDDLRDGPGHYPETAAPGRPGNAAIAGHRTTYGAVFHRLDELKRGDAIEVTQGSHTAWYRVMDWCPQESVEPSGGCDELTSAYRIVNPDDVDVLADVGDDRLTLTSEHPKYGNDERIVVIAELVSAPLPPPGEPPLVKDE